MQAGRERKRAERLVGAAERVAAWSAWVKADAHVTAQRASGNHVPRVPMVPMPSEADYAYVRGEAADD